MALCLAVLSSFDFILAVFALFHLHYYGKQSPVNNVKNNHITQHC